MSSVQTYLIFMETVTKNCSVYSSFDTVWKVSKYGPEKSSVFGHFSHSVENEGNVQDGFHGTTLCNDTVG